MLKVISFAFFHKFAVIILQIYLPYWIVLGNHSFAPEVAKSFCAPSTLGLLDGLTCVSKNLVQSSTTWTNEERDSMRNFILELVARADTLNVNHLYVLRNMHIWKFTGSSSANCYGALELQPLETGQSKPMLAPKMFAAARFQMFVPALLELGRFIALRNERDRSIFEKLKVEEASSGTFYSKQIVPRLDSDDLPLDTSILRILSFDILTNLDTLESENPGLKETLKRSKFVETNSGTFVPPVSLYDPSERNLVSLLPNDAFPSTSLYGSDSQSLTSLRALGMRRKLDCESVLRAAQSIFPSSLQLALMNENGGSMSTSMKENLIRAQGLLKYLDDNIETLISECDPEFLKNFIRRRTNGDAIRDRNNSDDSEVDIDRVNADDAPVPAMPELPGGSWGEKMRRIPWAPVMQSHPSTSKLTSDFQRGLEKFLPWPEPVHRIPIATPNTSVLVANRWLCSSTYRIIDASIQSDILIAVMGWKRPVPGNALAQQLLTLCGINTFADSSSGNESKSNDNYYQPQSMDQIYFIISRVYEALSVAMVSESKTLADIWLRALRNKAIIWTGTQLVEPDRLAFNWNIPLNTEPFLFVVKGDLLNYKPLLLALGVRENFDTSDIAGILRELQTTYGSSPLPDAKVDMCMGIIHILLKLAYRRYRALSSEARSNDAKLVSVSIDGVGADSQIPEIDEIEASMETLNEIDPCDIYWKLALSEMGPLYLPDSHGVLVPSHSLCFNDASWMAEVIQKHKFRFCHRLIEAHIAMLLGVKSLRAQLFTGDDVVCPKAAHIKSLISEYSSADAIADICALADEVKAEGVHMMLDSRQYSCESLINPNLDETQGPALLIYMDGVTFDREMLSKLFLSAQELLVLPFSCKLERRAIGKKTPESLDISGFSKFGRVGLRLLACFVLTDCLQVLTEDFYYVYDPNGKYLLNAAVSGSKNRETQRAQRCKLTGSEGDEFLSQFSDQVAPFRDVTFGFHAPVWSNKRLSGTILRLPLRSNASEISSYFASVEVMTRDINSTFHSILEGILLFGSSIEKGSSWMYDMDKNITKEVLTMQLLSPGGGRSKIGKFCQENTWKKSTSLLGSLFKSYSPEAEEFRVKLNIREMKMGTCFHNQSIESAMRRPSLVTINANGLVEHQEDWAVFLSMGLSRVRDLANNLPYSDIGCTPFVSVAARISPSESFADPSQPLPPGLLLCGGASVGISGLPYHINAPFLQVIIFNA
jgi:sacsin